MMVCTTTFLAYPNDYVFASRPTCVRYICCYDIIILEPSTSFVIVQGCGQTLGLGLGQSKDIVVVFY